MGSTGLKGREKLNSGGFFRTPDIQMGFKFGVGITMTRQAHGSVGTTYGHGVHCSGSMYPLSLPVLRATLCLALTFILTGASATGASAQVTLLVPSQPSIETVPAPAAKQPPAHAAKNKAAPQNGADASPASAAEVDVLITMMRPFQHQGLPMDMPQLFAVLRYDDNTPGKDGILYPERRDLLGDVEEIRYLEQRAWGANVALNSPGLHHFILEARPWWDAARQRFVQHYVKVTLPVHGQERGWNVPAGQRLEILPLTRPFGLTAPAVFTGQAVRNGMPMAGAPVRMFRINTDKRSVPTPWHEELAARADSNGQFAFVLNLPGWWCCQATMEDVPLKGPDGQPKPLELSALFWLYVDPAREKP
ncbi:MAG: DUF4198 domain-containing protein [Desulfovibrionaceae bacterium]|nr:DUF4198 domain-containing protein [Desulfovibrionaceae bacterium]